jgi:S1-C subfamily serine protease
LKGSSKQVDLNGRQAQVGGDVITAINDQTTKDFDTLVAYLAISTNVNDTVKLTFLRDNKEMTTNLTLAPRPASVANNNQNPQRGGTSGRAQLGVNVTSVTSDIAAAMKLPANTVGALIENIQPGSPAEKAGLQGSATAATINGQSIMVGGDIITKVDDVAITSVQDLQSVVSQHKPGDVVILSVLRDGKSMDLKVTF